MNENLTGILKVAIHQAQSGKIERKQLYTNSKVSGKHEFLFFIKPEITIQSTTIQLEKILDLVQEKIEAFNLQIKNTIILPAKYLATHEIIAKHYGVINAIARDAQGNLSTAAKEKFKEHFGKEISGVEVYGGLELIKAYPSFAPQTVDYIWQNSPTIKLGGGAYCQELKFDGKPVYLVNGFHPRQLEHFIADGRSIIAFTLVGDLSWKEARNKLIGKTNPNDAEPGSIRRTLLDKKVELGLSAVNSSWNGVHLSAGPVEGLVELIRYNSDFNSGKELALETFVFGKMLIEQFNNESIQKILDNSNVVYEGKEISIFDLTEELNATDALNILKKAVG